MSLLLSRPVEYTHNTLLLDQESWLYLDNYRRLSRGGYPLKDDQKERLWTRVHKEGDRARVTVDTFGIKLEKCKVLLDKVNLTYEDDGKKEEGFYV